MLTITQEKTAQSIINIFETSSVRGDYSNVTLLEDDPGHLTYGRSQTTLASGNLFLLIRNYCNLHGKFSQELSAYLTRLELKDFSLDFDNYFHNLLRAAADEAIMRDTQDLFFDQYYWQPALRTYANMKFNSPLGAAIVYDSFIQGSWIKIRNLTNQQYGSPETVGEHAWLKAYVKERRKWLANNDKPIIRATVYRMEAFQSLINNDCWQLELPLVVDGTEISTESLNSFPPNCYNGPQPGSRILTIESPLLKGLDVRLVQLGLSKRRINIKADGIFGRISSNHIRNYQLDNGFLPATGIADINLISHLCS
jgi:chitosanase